MTDRANDTFNIGPVADDQVPVEPVTEQWRKPAIALRGFESVEAPVGQARNARLEIEPEEMHRREYDVGNAASIDVQCGQIGVAVMAEEPIERMDGFSCRAGDHRLVQRRVAVGDGGVDLDHWVATIMGVDRSAGFARPAQVEGLAIRGSPVSLPKPGGDRLGVDGVGQTGERRPKGFLAHVPCLHAQQRAA